MQNDWSKLFLFVVLSLVVLVLVSDKRSERPLANAPLDGETSTQSETPADNDLITRGAGWANVACNQMTPPLSLVMPRQGVQPAGGCND